ncbi:FAD-dependent oxidoreductase [Paraburkholderia aspalathi]|uniref:Anthranilate 1,2-dioxygenase system ferredoxin--NAD(+) reductase component n=1 Tax=Paraburkholderia nemoris TaxID=2793076 RepID=A0ABM8S4R3_9BURK|nr:MULTISPECIES: anthranilate 1,2-dioxygenase system ferredoxin--NAD(+) reductase [Paraburkholderia]MBK3812898.1 FAD-dependent oxidoreductase [Paraburkholderia aspalathi]CAE6788404.1 Anthranilate 1,2-dioxygenase system ferredoxin--NAD(+) reductase component [Paraburkholderia nemoris]
MSNERHVIVGAGHAARRAAETLRALNADVPIVMIGEEPHAPYDRPVLSKDALMSEEGERKAFIRPHDWYAAHRIDLRLSATVTEVDRKRACVRLHDGSEIGYDRLLLATGSRVRRFGGPVDERVPSHYVRTLADVRTLRAVLAPGKRVAILGGGFIGLEVAAAVTQAGCKATVIEPAPALLQRALPDNVAQHIAALHERNGVDLRLGTMPRAILYDGGGTSIEIDAGTVAADVVVVGIGVLPNVELARACGLEVRNGIVVDERCRTNDPSIYAAGEVTMHANPMLGRSVRIESWQVAENQPVVAAENMLGGRAIYAELPWLWSDQFDCNVQTLGIVEAQHRLVTRGDPTTGSFCVMALDETGRMRAAITVNSGRDIGACRRLIAGDTVLDDVRLADASVSLRSLL